MLGIRTDKSAELWRALLCVRECFAEGDDQEDLPNSQTREEYSYMYVATSKIWYFGWPP